MALGVWFVMFASKFVFLWTIDLVFGNDVNINGFFGIFLVALVVTLVHGLADWLFVRLGQRSKPERVVAERPKRPTMRLTSLPTQPAY